MLTGTAREAAAEFLGTFVLIVFGVGVNAQVALSEHEAGEWISINIAWGIAVTLGIFVSGGVSGAHLNPAVTLAFAVGRGFSWSKVLPYWVAQVAGAFAASAVVFFVYYDALEFLAGTVRDQSTAGIWATYPQPFARPFPTGLLDQVVGTGLLLGCIAALNDRRNTAPEGPLGAIMTGSIVAVIGMSFGYNVGYAINPARDFGPRVFTAIAGWGSDVFRYGDHWWWVPIVGPLIGGVVGVYVYDLFITWHHGPEET